MTHVMLDIETWGKVPGCDIRSIGAVVFDPVSGTLTDKFYIATENPVVGVNDDHYCHECGTEWIGHTVYKYNLHRDPETVKWWEEQSEAAQSAFDEPLELRLACQAFSAWLLDVNGDDPTTLRLWANDPHFDVAILGAVYRAVGLPEPWHYRSPRSQKTVTELAGMTREDYKPFAVGTEHNAIDDAVSQAWIVCEAYRRLGKLP